MPRKAKKSTSRKPSAAKKSATRARKAAGGLATKVKKAAANPKRTVRRVAEKVHATAARADEVGDTVITAGQILKETAAVVDSMATRAKRKRKTVRKRSRSN